MDATKSFGKILVVEDDERASQLQRQRLELHGYVVEIATTCEDAIASAKKGVDLVVLDYFLGDGTGLDICVQFRRLGLDLPVVLLAGTTKESPVIQALRLGVQDVVPKTSQYLDLLPEAADRVLQQAGARKKLRAMEVRQRQSQKMEALGQLASGVAHEFNNLLQIIQGFTEGVQEKVSDQPELRDELQLVLDAASRAATITGQLLTFGRCDSIAREAVDVRSLILDTIKMMRPLLGRRIKIETHLDPELVKIGGSEAMLGQVIMNLCLNARDAMAGEGQLTISCSNVMLSQPLDLVSDLLAPGRYIRLQVTDTGTGISPEHLSRLYEPFYTTKPAGEGTGLGLATVFGIVKEHAGSIKVDSSVGAGTTFTIYLPQASSVSPVMPAEPASSASGTETILVADDEDGVRQYLERVLSRSGYRILTAEDGEEALEVFRRHEGEIQLLVLDLMMPRMSGRAAWQCVRAIRPNVKCVFLSGYDPESEQFSPESEEPIQILQKPVSRRDLLRAVRELLDERSHPADSG